MIDRGWPGNEPGQMIGALGYSEIIGSSPVIQQLKRPGRRVAQPDTMFRLPAVAYGR